MNNLKKIMAVTLVAACLQVIQIKLLAENKY